MPNGTTPNIDKFTTKYQKYSWPSCTKYGVNQAEADRFREVRMKKFDPAT